MRLPGIKGQSPVLTLYLVVGLTPKHGQAPIVDESLKKYSYGKEGKVKWKHLKKLQ